MLADLQAAGGIGGGAASEEHNRLAELPEVREKISAMMAAHWEHWVDQPIPILGNRTPMEAVEDPDGREIVESLVMQAERTGRSPNLPKLCFGGCVSGWVSPEAEANRQGVPLQAAEQPSLFLRQLRGPPASMQPAVHGRITA